MTFHHLVNAAPISGLDGERFAHWECALRMTQGGIGHLTDHEFWCLAVGDPDGGLTYRASALAVARWYDENEAAEP